MQIKIINSGYSNNSQSNDLKGQDLKDDDEPFQENSDESDDEDYDSDESSEEEQLAGDSDSDSDAGDKNTENRMKGRKGNEDLKRDALMASFVDVAHLLSLPCNNNCFLDKKCAIKIPLQVVIEERVAFFNPIGVSAPTEKEKAEKIIKLLIEKSEKDSKSNLCFRIDKNRVCPASLLRIIGLSNSLDLSRGPGQFRRLLQGYLAGLTPAEMLESKNIKLDREDKFTVIKGFIEAFITDLAEFFSDALPTVKSDKASTETKQMPYKSVHDVYEELCFQCATADPPVPESIRGSLSTFKKVFKKMKMLGKIQLLGGKSGFDTCTFCNHCLAMRKSAAAKRDRQLIDIVRALQRMHLKQQQIERQHCENYIHYAKTQYNDLGEPTRFLVELDGMSVFKTLAPKLQKERKHQYPQMENRLIGVRIVCGPIDQYIGICTSNVIPGGANVLIECTRLAIEILAKKLSQLARPFYLPERGGFNYDNCGENKVLVHSKTFLLSY